MSPIVVKKGAARMARSAVADEEAVAYNFVLTCGNRTEIFPPERFHEIQREVDRYLGWGHPIEEVRIEVLEADDPFK